MHVAPSERSNHIAAWQKLVRQQRHVRPSKMPTPPEVRFEVDGNYTLAIAKKAGVVQYGIAKRNPNDDPNRPERGRMIAFVRAARKLLA